MKFRITKKRFHEILAEEVERSLRERKKNNKTTDIDAEKLAKEINKSLKNED